ncbi:PREDICTED: placenta-specific gene 8 protein-like [Ceratotherium simum simum]|uniref:Placenta-specific gene 8 protein-like n=1 Tax=Ceratotherium simum simum TaxID=73337 RepID=A0ABM1CUU6_CERSS|nr:PREDICTED: placenta-specific gene 8 protein-like [Ceratotherium simum simum]
MQSSAPVVIVTQPGSGRIAQTSNWQTGMCDCFSDCGVCFCGTFCFMCLACQVASDMNECCLCGTSVAMRTLYRTRYGIPVSLLQCLSFKYAPTSRITVVSMEAIGRSFLACATLYSILAIGPLVM